MNKLLNFQLPKNQSSIIKVIGVGGGGGNAVNHMYKQGITGVDFIICNTDAQAMELSPVPLKIQLGANLTGGLGAGAAPSVGRNAALENADDIRAALNKGTKMLFITAGLGGGTGTGAAPVIAQISKELDILTVGIVTMPFSFEGRKRSQSAEDGIRQLKEHVDALLIISNDKLRLLCGDLPLTQAFTRADNVLTTAAKGIAEIITVIGHINVDFEDVKTVMKNSGVAIMGTGIASGENRAQRAVEEALNSPLLDNNDINGAGNLLLYISSGKSEVTMDEVTEITDYIKGKTKSNGDVIWGSGFDESLNDGISITIVATGFDEDHKPKVVCEPEVVKVFGLYGDNTPKLEKRNISPEPVLPRTPEPRTEAATIPVVRDPVLRSPDHKPIEPLRSIEFIFDKPEPDIEPEPAETLVDEFQSVSNLEPAETQNIFQPPTLDFTLQPIENETNDFQAKKSVERVSKLRQLSEKLKMHQPIEQNLGELENIPAYKRRNVVLTDVAASSESQQSECTVFENEDKSIELRTKNRFLHNIID